MKRNSLEHILRMIEAKIPIGHDNFYTLLEICKTARTVRAAQRTYFAERTQSNLIESKRLEKILDGLIKGDD